MSPVVWLRVIGTPAPQGSKRAVSARNGGKPITVESGGDAFARWRNQVAEAAATARDDLGYTMVGPLVLAASFRFRMPKSGRPAATRHAGIAWKINAPDADKLARALGDGLQAGGLIADDAHLVIVHASKVELVEGWTGAMVGLRPANGLDLETAAAGELTLAEHLAATTIAGHQADAPAAPSPEGNP